MKGPLSDSAWHMAPQKPIGHHSPILQDKPLQFFTLTHLRLSPQTLQTPYSFTDQISNKVWSKPRKMASAWATSSAIAAVAVSSRYLFINLMCA